jgi:hypothetical protein
MVVTLFGSSLYSGCAMLVKRYTVYHGSHSEVLPFPGGAAILAVLPSMQARCLHHPAKPCAGFVALIPAYEATRLYVLRVTFYVLQS